MSEPAPVSAPGAREPNEQVLLDALHELAASKPQGEHQSAGSFKGINEYWLSRAHAKLYKRIRQIVSNESASAETMLEVGSYLTPISAEFQWIPKRTVTDMQIWKAPSWFWDRLGMEAIDGDFMNFPTDSKYDVVLCLQVVEHLPDDLVSKFIQKMVQLGKTTIVSTTYLHPHWYTESWGHLQDPIDKDKFTKWFGDNATLDIEIIENANPIKDPKTHEAIHLGNIVGIARSK